MRDETQVRIRLTKLADILRRGSISVRVVGYTDQEGDPASNQRLANQRANVVADLLVDLGVAREQISTVGRAELLVLSNISGPNSPNRRVEFELGFANERF